MIGYAAATRGLLGRHTRVTVTAELVAGVDVYPVNLTRLVVEVDGARMTTRRASLAASFTEPLWQRVREWATPTLVIRAGYVRPNGSTDVRTVFTGPVLDVNSSRPADELTITAADPTSRLLDLPLDADVNLAGASATTSLVAQLTAVGLPAPLVDPAVANVTLGAAWSRRAGDSRAQLVTDLADELAAQLVATADGSLYLRPEPTLVGPNAATFTVGEHGSVLHSGSDYSRSAFANRYTVITRYRNTAGDETVAQGQATDTDPASPTRWDGPAGRVHVIDVIDRPLAAADLTRIAKTRLVRLIGAGRGVTITVPLTLWVDLYDRIYVQLPWGSAWDHLAQRITHDLNGMTTTIDTRRPLSTAIT